MATKKSAPKKSATKRAPTAKKAAAKKAPAKRAATPRIKKNRTAPVPKLATLGKEGDFHVEVSMNGETFKGNTNEIAQSIRSLAPDKFSTKVVIRVSLAKKKKAKVIERVLNVPMARLLFTNKMRADLFEKAMKIGTGYGV